MQKFNRNLNFRNPLKILFSRFQTYPLMNSADKTGTHPFFNTGRVYRLRNTKIIQKGNNRK